MLINAAHFQSSTVVRDLGVHLDAELSMKQHINKTTATYVITIFVVCDKFVDVLALKLQPDWSKHLSYLGLITVI